MGYRKQCIDHYKHIYNELFDIDVEDLEVHHIDNNHDNNKIENLLLIPSELHSLYHKHFMRASSIYFNVLNRMVGYHWNYYSLNYQTISEYLDVLQKYRTYMYYKELADLSINGGCK